MQSQAAYALESRTKYPKGVKSPVNADIFKKGSNNKKLGFNVESKRWNGKKLYYLTLEERKTCPRSCHHWDDCYGNNMPFAVRFNSGSNLETRIQQEIPRLIRKHPEGIVVRLHVLGDFYSAKYVDLWRSMLALYPTLSLFGYSAQYNDIRIGGAIAQMNSEYPDRCVIRFSRNKEYSAPADFKFAAEEGFKGDCFTCPEQTGKVKSCAACGLCWTAKKTVKFLSH